VLIGTLNDLGDRLLAHKIDIRVAKLLADRPPSMPVTMQREIAIFNVPAVEVRPRRPRRLDPSYRSLRLRAYFGEIMLHLMHLLPRCSATTLKGRR
jgi:hypothetical protein